MADFFDSLDRSIARDAERSPHTAEKDAATFTREDMARAYDAGVLDMSRALQGGNEPVNPWRVTPPGGSDV